MCRSPDIYAKYKSLMNINTFASCNNFHYKKHFSILSEDNVWG